MKTAELKLHTQYIKDSDGKESFVVLPTDEFNELLEDLEDLAAIADRRDEPTISLEELQTKLKQDGIL